MTFKASGKNRKDYFICKKCYFIGHGEVVAKGSKMMESVMWWVFFIPGPFYSLWRRMTKYLVCPKCKSIDLLSVDSPEGKRLFDQSLAKKI